MLYGLLGVIVLIVLTWPWIKGWSSPQLIGEAIHRIHTKDKVVALTYDDGPAPAYTTELLEILKDNGIKATFFVVGAHAEKHPDLIKAIYEGGHEIGNHTWSHPQLVWKWPQFTRDQISRTDALLRSLGYKGTIHFRAPYGIKFLVLPWILTESHRQHILFDVVPEDWKRPGVSSIVDRVVEKVRPGSIILLHDGRGDRSQTVAATPKIIHRLKEQGYRFVTISELVANPMRQ